MSRKGVVRHIDVVRRQDITNIFLCNDINFSNRTVNILGKGNKERIVNYGDSCEDALKLYLKEARLFFDKKNTHFTGKLSKKLSFVQTNTKSA